MADAVISVLVDQLVSRPLQKIEEEVRLVKSAKKEVQKLKKSLRLIQALLQDAGEKQHESASVQQWLSDLEEVSYDMDDLLGEWNATILMSEIEKQAAGVAGSGRVVSKKVDFRLPSNCFCFKQSVREVIGLREFSKKIKELNEELDGTRRLGNELGIVSRIIESSDPHPATSFSINKPRITTTSFVDETKIHGRVQDKAVLVSRLLCEKSDGDHSGKEIEIVPIVGMGGLGKTTLAQMAYNDDRVKSHFDTRIWVCVFDPFDIFKIAKALVEGLGGNPRAYEELEALMQFVSASIQGKRFLIVLDDVWSRDRETWDQLNKPLLNGRSGSKILVTTRNKEVAMMMGLSEQEMSTLQMLSHEQCWSIIKQIALVQEEHDDFLHLEAIGKKIAAKCKGLPLPAKILGGLMCFKKSKKQWEDILHSQLWDSKDFDKIFAPFLVSYYTLSQVEKCCFLYCSSFPKDQVIDVEMLVEIWISQGYFDESSKGLECFESLAMRFYLQDFQTTDGGGHSCKMHDIVHDFAQYLSRDKFFIMEGDIVRERIESLDGQAHHLTIILKSDCQFSTTTLQEMNNGCKFRSLFFIHRESISDTTGFDFLNLSCFRALRTLNLKNYEYRGETFLHKFPKMVHLRFVDLSGIFTLKVLPESLCDLINLQTLRLSHCLSLERLPTRFGKLVNLRHLYISGCNSLKGFPVGFENLTRLQTLDVLLVPANKKDYFDASDLRKLKELRFLGILTVKSCSNFTNAGEAEKLSIKTMEDLTRLDLIFDYDNPIEIGEDDTEAAILEALKPHPNLPSMLIWHYKGMTMSPTWLPSLTNLKFLRIAYCRSCKSLPPLGRLPSLEKLSIFSMRSVKKVGPEFLGMDNLRDSSGKSTAPFVSFPRLKELQFQGLSNWREWEGISEAARPRFLGVMPSLSSLTITWCSSLEALPDFLLMTPLQSLSIDWLCDNLEKWCREEEGKEWLQRSNVRDIPFS